MKRLWFLVGLFLAAAGPVVQADTELVLKDGQTLIGSEVRKRGSAYVLVLESGKLLSIPVELVEEVRLVEEQLAPPGGLTPAVPQHLAGDVPTKPSGLRLEEPDVLAGRKVVPPQIDEQLEALGPPARFRRNVIDPFWVPHSDWKADPSLNNFAPSRWARSIIDPRWRPLSAYGDEDVLRPGHARWREGIIDPIWVPSDGFAKRKADLARARTDEAAETGPRPAIYAGTPAARSPVRFSFAPAVASPRMDPQECAVRLFGESTAAPAAAPQAQAIVDGRYLALPLQLYEASSAGSSGAEGGVRAVFTVDRGECRLISGDLEALLGVSLSRDQAVVHAAAQYNEALELAAPVRLTTERDKIRYAFAVSTLVDPAVSGHRRSGLTLLATTEQAQALAARQPSGCTREATAWQAEARAAVGKFKPPEVLPGAAGEVVTLFTWSDVDGTVERHAIRLAADGQVSVVRETVARHVGPHEDPR